MKINIFVKIIAVLLAAVTLFLFTAAEENCAGEVQCPYCYQWYEDEDPAAVKLHGLGVCSKQAPCGTKNHYIGINEGAGRHSECPICGNWLCDTNHHGEGICGYSPKSEGVYSDEGEGVDSKNTTRRSSAPAVSASRTPQKSSDAALKNITVLDANGEEMPFAIKFFSSVANCQTEEMIGMAGTKVTVIGEPADAKATVSGGGEITLKEGDNVVTLSVTAEDGIVKKDYTVTIPASGSQSGDWTLRTFTIAFPNGSVIDMSDAAARKNISVSDAASAVVTAVPSDAGAKVSGNVGTIALAQGENSFKVTVKAQNGTTKSFSFAVNMSVTPESAPEPPAPTPTPEPTPAPTPEPPLSNVATLSSLTVAETYRVMPLNPAFSPDVYEYSGEVNFGDTPALNITAVPTDAKATVTGAGTCALQAGLNTITITVTAEDGVTVKTYRLLVYADAN